MRIALAMSRRFSPQWRQRPWKSFQYYKRWIDRAKRLARLLRDGGGREQPMLYKIQHRQAAFRHVLGQPDVPLPDLACQRSCRKIVLNHSEDRENRLVRIDGTKLPAGNSFPDCLDNSQVQRAVVRDHHPVKPPPVGHHFPLDETRIGGIAHHKIEGRVHQSTHAVGRLHGSTSGDSIATRTWAIIVSRTKRCSSSLL